MFGHDDDNSNDENHQGDQAANDVIKPSTSDNDTPKDGNWQHPGLPTDGLAEVEDDTDTTDVEEAPAPSAPPVAAPAPPAAPTPHISGGNIDDSLIDLKQQALTKLSPLVDQLDLAAEEKFRTLMMMIQASDDQSLVKQAYETALKIDDEKEKAQALLDIVNEINYFTQNPGAPAS